jgi:hypothetical protein
VVCLSAGSSSITELENQGKVSMTKKQELDALYKFASEMGTGSYIGEWLLHIFPVIQKDLSSDYVPMETIRDSIAKAEAEAGWIRTAAENDAARIVQRAKAELLQAETVKARAVAELDKAERLRSAVLSAIAAAESRISNA